MSRRFRPVSCAAAIVVSLASPAAAQDIAGKWDLTISTPQGSRPAELTLRKEGEKFVGEISRPSGNVPVTAAVKDKQVTMTMSVQTTNNSFDITLTGTVDGDTMKGTADFAGQGQGEWSATRPSAAANAEAAADAKAIDVTGTWIFDVTSDAGSGSPTLTFKQDGEKLTGQYSGQLGEAPFTGTLKGRDLSIGFDVQAQGASIRITYAGTVDKDTIKGTVNLGDMAQGTFTGKRKQ